MADNKQTELGAIDRGYIKAGLAALYAITIRKRNSETPGSEVYAIRVRELAEINATILKVQ